MNLIAYKIVDTIFIRGDGSNAFGDYIPGSGSSSSSSLSTSSSSSSSSSSRQSSSSSISSSSSSGQSNSSSSSSVCLNWLSWGSEHYGLKNAPQGLNISNIKEIYRVNGTNIILDTLGKLWIWGKCDKGLCNIPDDIGIVRSIGVSVSDNNIIANADNGLYFWGDNYQSRCSGKLLSCSFDLDYPDGDSSNRTQQSINPYQIGEDFHQYKNNGEEELQSEQYFTVRPDSSSGHYWKWKPVLHVITTSTGGITRTERTTHQFNSLSPVHASLGSLAINVDTIYEWEESPKIYNQNNQWVNHGGDYITQWKSFGWNGSCSLFGDSKMCLTHKSNHVRWDGDNPSGVQLANTNYAQEKIVNGWTMMFINFQNQYVIDKCGRNLHNELDVHSSMTEWKDMACGWSHCCGINSGDQIVCWGENEYGQLNIPFQLNFAKEIWVGANTTIALDENNILWSWGQNTDGQCGTDAERYKWDGTLNPTGTRQDSLGSFTGTGRAYWKKDLSSIKIKTIITSAIMKYNFVASDGFTILLEEVSCDTISSSSSSSSPSSEYCTELYAYGANDWYQSEVPLNLKFGNKQISAGKNHNLVIKNDNTVAAWGKNHYGQCNVPSSLGPCKAISAGRNYSVALKNDGSVVAWGYNNHGQCLGTDSEGYVINTPEVSTGTQLAQIDGIPLTNIIAIAAGVAHTVCLTDTGKVLCFGAGGKIREYSTDADKQQCEVPSLLNTDIYPCVAIAAGDYHTVALQSNGNVHLWGRWNGGLNTPECWNFYGRARKFNKINAGSISSIFADENGYCILYEDVSRRWSRGEYDPTVVGGIRQIEVGRDHAVILNNNNTIWARGRNNFNQLSVRDDNIDNAISISAGDYHTLILTSNCTLTSSSSSSSKTCTTPDTATPRINMLRLEQSGIDQTQYVEFSGQPGLDLSEYTFIIIGEEPFSNPLSSIIEYILPLTDMSISSDGYYSVASYTHEFLSPNRLPDKLLNIFFDNFITFATKTYMIVKGFTGILNMVINTTNSGDSTTGQGIIDVSFGEIVDSFATGSSDARIPDGTYWNWYYSTNIAKVSNYNGVPSKVNRCINGTYESDYWNNEFSQDGDRLGVCHYCVGE